MMRKPSQVCPVCQRKNCTDESHKRDPFRFAQSGPNRTPRRVSYAERQRRKRCVDQWLAEYGAWCPECGAVEWYDDGTKVVITADHVTPVALGGAEDGPLKAMCKRCQSSQGARIRNRMQRPQTSRVYRMGE